FQTVTILKQNEAGTPVLELCLEHSISDSTFYKWHCKYVEMGGRCHRNTQG
ncbi:MAG: transposase, partial [Gammaproteobacteria bacterium]|nr:transposase [Gammaproteobacteria bacterium]